MTHVSNSDVASVLVSRKRLGYIFAIILVMNKRFFISSLLLAVLIAIASIYGLYNSNAYLLETVNWATQSKAQDLINLFIAVPVLLISAILAYRKSLAAYLIWLGNLVFIVYSFILYAFFVHFNAMFLIYSAIIGFTIYLLIYSLVSADSEKIKASITLSVKLKKIVSLFLILLGVLFYLVWLKDIIPNLLGNKVPNSITEAGLVTNGVYVIDIAILLPALILSGYYLRKNKSVGYLLVGILLPFSLIMMVNIAFIIYYLGTKGLPTDNSVLSVFGFLSLLTLVINALYFKNIKKSLK